MAVKKVLPGVLNGTVTIPASKSIAHRALICAALAEGTSVIRGLALSQDIQATIQCMKALGAQMNWEADTLIVKGINPGRQPKKVDLDCGESGSTLRFLIPVAGALGAGACFTGRGRLKDRPLSVYEEVLQNHGLNWTRQEDWLPLEISGQLTAGTYKVRGDVSSQFITGLLLALPLLPEDSKIEITTELESEPYVNLTLAAMHSFGVTAEKIDTGYWIRGGQRYRARDYTVEGDYSQAAFILAAGVLAAGEDGICLKGLLSDTLQGDAKILDILKDMGAEFVWEEENVLRIFRAKKLENVTVDASQCPDLVPVIAALGCYGEGVMRILRAARLRLKESDRLSAVHTEYAKLGAEITELPDGLEITGHPEGYLGGCADSQNDHRIAMALAVFALGTDSGVTVQDAESVCKSWPDFWEDFAYIGGNYG